jgi:hypothetical protein
MRCRRIAAAVALAVVLAVGAACARRALEVPGGSPPPERKLGATSYYDEGAAVFLGVDVRASRLSGPQEFLPLLVALQVKVPRLEVRREHFVLELEDGTMLPLVSYREFSEQYRRAREDLRAGRTFLETLTSRFPEPPFTHRPFDFYPLKWSSSVPRDTLGLRQGELGFGYLYFRMPHTPPPEARFKLLLHAPELGETYVLEFPAYRPR